MPIYEYQCTECGERFEVRQNVGADGSSLSCPKCHSGNPRKLLSLFSTQRPSGSGSSDISCLTNT